MTDIVYIQNSASEIRADYKQSQDDDETKREREMDGQIHREKECG